MRYIIAVLATVAVATYVGLTIQKNHELNTKVNNLKKEKDNHVQEKKKAQKKNKDLTDKIKKTEKNQADVEKINKSLKDDIKNIKKKDKILKEKNQNLLNDNEILKKENAEQKKLISLKQKKKAEKAKQQQMVAQNKTSHPKASTVQRKTTVNEKQHVEQAVRQTSRRINNGRTVTVEATAYVALCDTGCTGVTATGIDLKANPNAKVIAVDPSVIPLGSKVHVPGYGIAIAGDTGGAIKGHRIDIFVPNVNDARSFGRKTMQVKVLS